MGVALAGHRRLEGEAPLGQRARGSVGDARDRQRDPLPGPHRLLVALPPARPAAAERGLLLHPVTNSYPSRHMAVVALVTFRITSFGWLSGAGHSLMR
jgi:hypothetical protein